MKHVLSLEFPWVIIRSEDKQMYVVLGFYGNNGKYSVRSGYQNGGVSEGRLLNILFYLVSSTFTIELHLQITVAFDVEILRNLLFFPSGNGLSAKDVEIGKFDDLFGIIMNITSEVGTGKKRPRGCNQK